LPALLVIVLALHDPAFLIWKEIRAGSIGGSDWFLDSVLPRT
jgi:hypothetical protein